MGWGTAACGCARTVRAFRRRRCSGVWAQMCTSSTSRRTSSSSTSPRTARASRGTHAHAQPRTSGTPPGRLAPRTIMQRLSSRFMLECVALSCCWTEQQSFDCGVMLVDRCRIPNRVGVAGHVSATGEVLRVSLWQQCTDCSAWQSRRPVALDRGRQRREQIHTSQMCSALPNGTRLAGLRGSHRSASLALSQDE